MGSRIDKIQAGKIILSNILYSYAIGELAGGMFFNPDFKLSIKKRFYELQVWIIFSLLPSICIAIIFNSTMANQIDLPVDYEFFKIEDVELLKLENSIKYQCFLGFAVPILSILVILFFRNKIKVDLPKSMRWNKEIKRRKTIEEITL